MPQYSESRPVDPAGRDPRALHGFAVLILCVSWVFLLRSFHPSSLPGDLLLQAGLAAVPLLTALGARIRVREFLAIRPIDIRTLLIVMAMGAAFTVLLSQLSILLIQWLNRQGVTFDEAAHVKRILDVPWPVRILLFVGMAPLAEEMVFRGALLQSWRRGVGPAAALVATSVIFGMIHPVAAPIAMLGLFLGMVVLATGSLAAGIAAHAVNNAIVLATVSESPAVFNAGILAAGIAAFVPLGFLFHARIKASRVV